MYVDELDGRIDGTFFDRKASEWRAEQHRIRQTIQTHQTANESYFDEGLRLLELARRAHMLFRRQPENEKRRLLDFVVSNCTWTQGELRATYHQPFDLLAIAAKGEREESPPRESSRPVLRNWLPFVDAYRTICLAPTPEIKTIFGNFQSLDPSNWPRECLPRL